MISSKFVVSSIKKELRRQGISYKILSGKLGISESATKKMFANKNFSLHRLDAICQILDVDLLELAEKSAAAAPKINQLTKEQELKIIADKKWFIVAYAAINYWTVEDIIRRYKITKAEVIKYLLRLEKFGLIELRPNNRIRPLVSHDFKWSSGGPLEKFFREHFFPDFFNSEFKEPGTARIVKNGDLSDESRRLLDLRFKQLGEFFEELCFADRQLKPGNMERKGTSMVLAFRTWTIPVLASYTRN
ncbi:MAG: helix-turn-helix transcriptional regulator [Gammaproteobacteria bacterium]|nr:helix-turn-helix transcriptional regulator [Gammaproteobacteria bacterium]